MNGFADVVQHAINAKKVTDTERASNAPINEQSIPDIYSVMGNGAHATSSPKTPPALRHFKTDSINRAGSQDSSGSSPPPSHTQTTRSPHDSPSSRTGPPRSFSYSITRSPNLSRQNTRAVEDDIEEEVSGGPDYGAGDENDGGYGFPADSEGGINAGSSVETRPGAGSRLRSSFRGALEYIDPEQREKEREAMEKREKNRMSKIAGEDSWINPLKWINGEVATQESPQTDGEGWTSYFDFLKPGDKGKEKENTEDEAETAAETSSEKKRHKRMKGASISGHSPDRSASHDDQEKAPTRKRIERSHSMPHMKRPSPKKTHSTKGAPRWNRLRSLIPSIAQQGRTEARQGQIAVQPHVVNITDELIAGGLSALMLKLWFERDERGARRIPVLLHRLRVRISDSIHPLKGNKAVFRIECEYANGAVRWVVYRQLRDFVSLHTHYKLSNTFNRNVDALPEFPRTSLPYFKFLREKGKENEREIGRADFAIMQREALENYLIGLIRAVMFHPTSNRLAGFLEISALSIQLAQSGGWQAKAGLLTIEPASKKSGGFGRRNASWSDKKKQRWCALREGYLVAVEDPAETTIWDVFLLDSDFKIERPKRYYRQGFHILHSSTKDDELSRKSTNNSSSRADEDTHSTLGKVKAKFRSFRVGQHHRSRSSGHVQWSNGPGGSLDRNREHTRTHSGVTSASESESDRTDSEDEDRSPMVDPSTNIDPLRADGKRGSRGANARETDGEGDINDNPDLEKAEKQMQKKKGKRSKDVSKHTFFVSNSQMRLKLYAKSERQMQQWITALERVAQSSYWTGSNRFGSFAPIRLNVAAQWLVDGRDYMWNLSRAIMLARERIYIHDWWLSPELQMRRPHKERYRLDKLLERKAKEGVKIYVILYQEVSNRTTPTDSNYTKQRLTSLHPNILVQRSPSHFQTGTFYWAHHEKLCVIDEAIAFMGGVDLCFGRWDTPQHILIDDPDLEEEGSTQIWPGKDYSNARISDFFTLTKPFEDMYDRQKVPRMPWHDVGMHIVGQPARDLCRHFVQRWNYLLRIKNHSRTMPFLLPPPDFKPHELDEQGLTGTCEIQICRSCGPWSMGTSTRVESSIQNAYLKAIQMSDHFVYIENQFFITSTTVNDTVIENRIGDALVSRIIRAHREGTNWKACIMIPLLPGFPFPVDHSDASSVRIILECQNRTICRGPHSIYGRLRKEGINPEDYITVFCLRNWGKLPGNVLTSEMVYIHGKVCIVDDRLAIIGSANINERSQRGDRDSEIAAIIRDTDMIDGTMDGKPYKVGRFAHTLRVRLMREHIGVDVDAIYEEDLMSTEPSKDQMSQEAWDPESEQQEGMNGVTQIGKTSARSRVGEALDEIKDSAKQVLHGTEDDTAKDAGHIAQKVGLVSKASDAAVDDKALREERQTYTRDGEKEPGFTSSIVPTLEEKTIIEQRPPKEQVDGELPPTYRSETVESGGPPEARVHDGSHELYGAPANSVPQADNEVPHARDAKSDPALDTTDEEKAALHARRTVRKHLEAGITSQWALPTPTPHVDPHGFEDPVCDAFWKNTWVACAVHNTEIFRKVFHCIPDDTVTTWKQYKEFVLHHERMNKPVKDTSEPLGRVPSEAGDEDAPGRDKNTSLRAEDGARQDTLRAKSSVRSNGTHHSRNSLPQAESKSRTPTPEGLDGHKPSVGHGGYSNSNYNNITNGSGGIGAHDTEIRRAPSRADRPFEKWERDEMEKLLGELRGHLVLYPTRFLEGEDAANNFLFNADRLLPMPIYD